MGCNNVKAPHDVTGCGHSVGKVSHDRLMQFVTEAGIRRQWNEKGVDIRPHPLCIGDSITLEPRPDKITIRRGCLKLKVAGMPLSR
jgi:hypothetical protein